MKSAPSLNPPCLLVIQAKETKKRSESAEEGPSFTLWIFPRLLKQLSTSNNITSRQAGVWTPGSQVSFWKMPNFRAENGNVLDITKNKFRSFLNLGSETLKKNPSWCFYLGPLEK
uniref:Uncharacterized protein n=1 Tax=Sphaerodactylus townsendi TaxID=933632 RepID=A0ACB8FM09_9SAUR